MRQTLIALGVGFISIGISTIAQAQSEPKPELNDDSVTLSGESLTDIENRTTSGDFQTFFSESPNGKNRSGSISIGAEQSSPTVEVEEGVGLVFGDTLNFRDNEFFQVSGENDRVRQVKLEFDLDN